jgi:tetratricopeptide (TPR) repeat protein
VYRALIVCNYRFPAAQGSLRDLQGPKRDGLLLRDALTDHDTGMFEKANVRNPLNDAPSGEILEAVEEFFESAEPDDTLLFYYSGHGRSRDQELYLCAQNTDPSRLRSTAVSGRVLRDIVGSSSSLAQAKILVFDCCYSALFKGDDDREITELFGTGRYVLAATSAAERAPDGAQKGMPSPFTKALADALMKEAEDLDGDGKVDLDDVYRYLKTVSFDGARPHQNFEGAGTVPIARRDAPMARDAPRARLRDDAAEFGAGNPHSGMHVGRDSFSAARDVYITYPSALPDPNVPYLDRPVSGVSFSPALVAEFRKGMRDDVRERMPDSLTDAQFLDRAGLLTRDGSVTYAGLLLFGAHPTQALPSAVVQCVRFHGTTNTAPREITDFHDPIPQLIVRAYDFVAGVARTGDTPTDSGPRAEPAYRYPMVAVREIIANALVHRDYDNQKSCVQIHAFEDRIEVHSPGVWQGAAVTPGTHPLGELARTSERRNFRIAQPLTWSRLMEGAGTGVARSVEECGKAGAQEPLVAIDEGSVKVTIFPRSQPSTRPQAATSGKSGSFLLPTGIQTHVWGDVPYRNPHFTGREAEIQRLHDELTASGTAVLRHPPASLFGMGGVGKTQIATEYAHRFVNEYEVVWWVHSDQEDNIQSSLVALGTRLQLPNVSPADRDRSLNLVIDALQSGSPYRRWLIIFDDVRQPEQLARYIPRNGHVIVTSRVSEWHTVLNTDGIEVKEFSRAETVMFLRDRVPQLAQAGDAEVDRLASVLGDLPLAAEHAAAYLHQMGSPVSEYIAAFQRNAHELFAQEADMYATSRVVSTTWSVTQNQLSPEARELFQLLAFFAAEPIADEILLPGVVFDPPLPEPLQQVLRARANLKRAQRELARFSLITLYGQRNVTVLHRVVQAVTRARILKENPALARTLREAVFSLLATSSPDSPEREENDPAYERSIPHLIPTGALESGNERLRALIINQVLRLRLRGGVHEALALGEPALALWKAQPDDIQALALAVEVAWCLRAVGRIEEAYTLDADTLKRLSDGPGQDNETYLDCARGIGDDLRALGQYDQAYEHDRALIDRYDEVFGPGQGQPLTIRSNFAVDMRCTGRYEEALDLDTYVLRERLHRYGATEFSVLASRFGVARDLRQVGRYEDALQASRELVAIYQERNSPWNFLRLSAYNSLSVSLRRAGYYEEAREVAEDTYQRYVAYAGPLHPDTLSMATNLMCDRRMTEDLTGAQTLGEATVTAWTRAVGEDNTATLNARSNLAIILRVRYDPAAAQEMNQATLASLQRRYSYDHPDALLVMTNLASDLAAIDEARQARHLGQEVLAKSRTVRGEAHPATLAAASNLALDLRATGDGAAADELAAATLAAFEADDQLTPEHPQVQKARQQGRINVDIEPMYY